LWTTCCCCCCLAQELELAQITDPNVAPVEPSYRGPHIYPPIDKTHFEVLLHAFQRGEVQ